jgi:hypothetical protein
MTWFGRIRKYNKNHDPKDGEFTTGDGGDDFKAISDKKGKPLVLYHGTMEDGPHTSVEGGIFLTTSKKLAGVYGGDKGKVMSFHVHMEKPLDMRDKDNIKAFNSGKKAKEDILGYAKRKGFDGVIDPSGSYIVPSAKQLKEVK